MLKAARVFTRFRHNTNLSVIRSGCLIFPRTNIGYYFRMSSNRRIVSTSLAPTPIGPYSQGVIVGQTAYLSGQLGINMRTNQLVTDSVKSQAHQAFTNMKAVVEATGGTMANVVKVNIFITSFDDFPAINEVMKEFFTAPFPARSTVGVAALPLGAKVELEAIVCLDQ